tara:strand:- start:147957 stop:148586 length:630 start_codon:yes stop_codon:yes gene_type:complete
MSDKNDFKKLSPISLEYALHIPHMMKAREIFETEVATFQNSVVQQLNNLFETEECKSKGFSIAIDKKASRTSGSCIMTSYYNEKKLTIYYKSPGKARKNVGKLVSKVFFDSARQNYSWKLFFKNEDKWDDQIDERCRQVMDQMDIEKLNVLTGHKYFETDEYAFFMIPFTENFRKNDFKVLEISTEVLIKAMELSNLFIPVNETEEQVA